MSKSKKGGGNSAWLPPETIFSKPAKSKSVAKAVLYSDRIISGALKGRKVMLPKSDEVRPSKNRVRQAAFNMLTARVEWSGLVVADLFCGSGAWGFEALSRGAGTVFCVDMDERVAAENIKAIGVPGIKAIAADVRTWRPPAPLDVVLADPPYGKGLAQALINRAADVGQSGSWWCVEAGIQDDLVWEGFTEVNFKDYGNGRVWVALQD